VLQNRLLQRRLGQEQRTPDYWLLAHRYTDSMTLIQAMKENMGEPEQAGTATVVGWSHSSDEVSVMDMERRALVI
jgi:hypothetical protein